jgi:hypothetical protein
MNNLTIECICCPSRREFNKFIRNTDKEMTKIIDHVSIKNKLIKSDPYGQDPSNSIIGLTIINEITRCLRYETLNVNRVIYLFKTMDFEIIQNFKGMVESNSEREFSISLTVINTKETIEERIISLFDSVNTVNND